MTTIDEPPLRDLIRRHGLSAKKALGQHFILDPNLTARIARAAGPLEGTTILEVGPGPGGLTRALLAQGARKVVAIERDPRCIEALADLVRSSQGRLVLVPGDALVIDPRPHFGPGPVRIVANLPYNVATALLMHWLSIEPWPPWYDAAILMFQREVAERLVAGPGSKAYGRLAVIVGWRTQASVLFDVKPAAFVPPPKVTSSMVKIVPRPSPATCDRGLLERVTEAAFGQRRKMLRQSLKTLGVDPLALLSAVSIDPTQRAEMVAVDGFVAMANALARMTGTPRPQRSF
jgi:16S rRNA (adenine1518-N6/adenine1519-N6)-dimethyltransferase